MAKKVTKKKAVASKSATPKKTAKKSMKKVVKTTQMRPQASSKSRPPSKRKISKSASKKPFRNTAQRVKTVLTKAELEHFRTLLLNKLKEIAGDVDHIEKELLQKSRQDATGDLSSMPIHMADIGSDNYEQEFTLGLMATERKIVQEILMAVQRIEDGTFGMCEGTGEPIPKARLEAYPWARYCVRYAEMIEKGQASEVQNSYYSGGNFAPSLADEEDADEEEEEESSEEEDVYEEDEDEALQFDEDEGETDEKYAV